MKKKFTLALLAAVVSFPALSQAPITITAYPVPSGPVNASYSLDMSESAFTPAAGTNNAWDYTYLLEQSLVTVQFDPYTNNLIPAVNMARVELTNELVPNYGYTYDMMFGMGSSEWAIYGHFVPAQSYSMLPVTGVSTDSIHIPEQTSAYSSPAVIMPFPLTFGTVWQSNYRYSVHGLVDISPMSLAGAPMEKRTHVQALDSVLGWGTIAVPLPGGAGNSQPYPVLLIKHTETTSDSLFLNGSPAPPALVAALGQVQGQTTIKNSHLFFRQGSMFPLAQFAYDNNTFTQPHTVMFDRSVQESPSSTLPELAGQVQLYPNPSTGILHLKLPETGSFNLVFTDLSGREVYAAKASFTAGTAQNFTLPASVTSGLYIWQLASENGDIISTGKISVQK